MKEQHLTVSTYEIHTLDNTKNIKMPAFMKALYIVVMAVGGMGEWRTVMATLGGLPKALSLVAVAMAFAFCLIKAEFTNLKKVYKTYLMYVMLIALILIWSFVIWILNFTDSSSITRGGEKMLYQLISVTSAASAVVLFGLESIDLFCIAMCISNSMIMLMEMKNFGIASSIQSFFTNIFTFGDAVGFARNIEIHELTFLFGMFAIYYTCFAPAANHEEKKKKYIFLGLSYFFFLGGMKRIAVLSVALAIVFYFLIRKRKNISKITIAVGIFIFFFYFYFLKTVRDGSFTSFMEKLGIDMMGRDYIWSLTNDYYELSPTFMGLGFEAVDRISKEWYNQGLIQLAFMFHNDILKVFVELGFPGFTIWSLIQYVLYPIYFGKKYNSRVALCYTVILIYMTITYMTDNTAFYFWCTMGLRLIPLGYTFSADVQQELPKWKPIDKEEYNNRIKDIVSGRKITEAGE